MVKWLLPLAPYNTLLICYDVLIRRAYFRVGRDWITGVLHLARPDTIPP